ncbi:MAG: stage II sporulation protein P [Clostridiales bacterium]|nr:stage II sporulation protein P [Clostridiales bacterium]
MKVNFKIIVCASLSALFLASLALAASYEAYGLVTDADKFTSLSFSALYGMPSSNVIYAEDGGNSSDETSDEADTPSDENDLSDSDVTSDGDDNAKCDADDNANDSTADGGEQYAIISSDLSTGAEYGLEASNQTSYEINLLDYLKSEPTTPTLDEIKSEFSLDEYVPVVLIIHTHGTEAYSDGNTYSESEDFRSTNIDENVVAVGSVMSDYFNSVGITTIHCTEMFDLESYVDAYAKSTAAVSEYTAIYPSISYVFDVHRDCIINDELECVSAVTTVNGESVAQFMCVVGTDEYAGLHTGWQDNLAFACRLQYTLWSISPSLTRRLSIRSASYNQLYASGSLLFEIGTCGNMLDEAKACALYVAEAVAGIILGG